ncbi:MAG: hypothetical protein PHG47_01755 [Sulfuricella sp.]|nr:hypothetical protein [Sulfuricella sp.]
MKHLPFLLLLALLSAMPGANAAEWEKIDSAAVGDQLFYDKAKLLINDNEITYWKKVVFLEPQPFKDKLAVSGLYREHINCADHTLKLTSYLLYGPAGETVEYAASVEGGDTPIIPDSLGDVFEKNLCPLVSKQQEEKRLKEAAEKLKEEAERLKAEQQEQHKLEEERLKTEAEGEKPPLPKTIPSAVVKP